MPTISQASTMAGSLRAALAARKVDLGAAATLDLVAAQLGFADWTEAAAGLDPEPDTPPAGAGIGFLGAIPILRSFDDAKARAFYCGFLGFAVTFEHRFAPALPLYMEVARQGLRLHLSEHHGDACPGGTVFVPMTGVRALHAELLERDYPNCRPGIEALPWGDQVEVQDPFGNRIRFCEQRP